MQHDRPLGQQPRQRHAVGGEHGSARGERRGIHASLEVDLLDGIQPTDADSILPTEIIWRDSA